MGWNLDTSIKGGGTGQNLGRVYGELWPVGQYEVNQGTARRHYEWYNIAPPANTNRMAVHFPIMGRAGANAAGFAYLYVQTNNTNNYLLASLRFHNENNWYAAFNQSLGGHLEIPGVWNVHVWMDIHNDPGSGTPLYMRPTHCSINWFS